MHERSDVELDGRDHSTRSTAPPVVRWIEVADVRAALNAGVDDFRAIPTHGILYGLMYALAGLILLRAAGGAALLPLLLPMVSGFALLGPFVAIGLYELSRRREQGLVTRWWHAFGVRRHLAGAAIALLGAGLALVFVLWLATAQALFAAIVGAAPPDLAGFARVILFTTEGWTLILVGHAVGFVFAAVTFTCTVVAFPLLVDRDVGLGEAVATSIRAVLANPKPMAAWALVIAAGLVVGSAPLLMGLPIVLPILGHASWHLYRRVVLA